MQAEPATLVLSGEVSEIARLGVWVSGFCAGAGLAGRVEFELNLVLEELATNAINHGKATRVELKLLPGKGEIAAEMVDDGAEFDPTTAAPPDLSGGIAERQIGGLGIHLVRQLVQGLAWQRTGDRNRLSFQMKVG